MVAGLSTTAKLSEAELVEPFEAEEVRKWPHRYTYVQTCVHEFETRVDSLRTDPVEQ